MRILLLIVLCFSSASVALGSEHKTDQSWSDGAREFLEWMADGIENNIRPSMQSAYAWYYREYGQEIGQFVIATLNLSAEAEPIEFSRTNSEARYPVFLKKSYENIIFSLYSSISKMDPESMDPKLQMPLQILKESFDAIEATKNPSQGNLEIYKKLHKALIRVQWQNIDKKMAKCLAVHLIESEYSNAYNTGCNIFVTKKTVTTLNEFELSAVIAHEMGHASLGHSLQNYISVLNGFAKHSGLLILDEMNWFLTNESYGHFDALQKKQFFDLIMSSFAQQAANVELEADLAGVWILENSNIPRDFLISALKKMIDANSSRSSPASSNESLRHYPELEQRIVQIMKF